MNSVIQWPNGFSDPWAAWIWRATWQAAIVIAVAWLLTVLLARQSPRFRSWIWRLAYIKLLVLLIWTTPLRLAVLPAEEIADAKNPQPPVALQDSQANPHLAATLTAAAPKDQEPALASHQPDAIHE